MSENRISNSFLQKRNRGIGDEDPFIIGDGEDNRPSYVKNFKPIKGKSRTTIVQEGIEQFGEAVVDDPVGVGKAIATGIKEDFLTFKKDPKKYVYDATANVVQSIKNVGTKSLSDYLPEGTTEERATAEQMTAARQAQLNDYLSASVVIPAASVVKQSSKIIRKALPETGLLNEPTFVNTTANLKSLLQGDREFLMESKNPNLQGVGADVVNTAAIGDNQGPELDPKIDSDDPGINPTKPKSEVAPLVRRLDADVSPITDRGDFYSPILANLDNLPIGKDGMLGSDIIKFLTKKASNINKTELNWSQLLFPGERVLRASSADKIFGIDPNRKYGKTEIKLLAKQNLPQIIIEVRNGSDEILPTRYGGDNRRDTQRVPVIIGEDLPTNLTFDRSDYQGWSDAVIKNNPSFEQDVTDDILDNFEDFSDYDFNRFANGIRNTPKELYGNGEDYVEIFLKNKNTLGHQYRASRSHFPDHKDPETIVAHARGSFYKLGIPFSTLKRKIFVVEELQTDAIQRSSGGGRVATEKTTDEIKEFTENKKAIPEIGSREYTENLADDLQELLTKNSENDSINPAPRFDRLAGIDTNSDLFEEQILKQKEALFKLSENVGRAKKIFEAGSWIAEDVVDFFMAEYNKFGMKESSLLRGTKDLYGAREIDKILSNAIGDIIYTKSQVRQYGLQNNITKALSDATIKTPALDLSPLKLSETVRSSLLAAMKNAKNNESNTLVIPPVKDIVKAHDGSKKAFDITYNTAVLKTLKSLNSETNGQITFKTSKLEGLNFKSGENYIIVDFSKFEIPKDSQLRLAEGGVVQPMEQQMQNILQEGGIGDDGMLRDPVSGNEIPPGSLANEVRDDIPAQLSEGEYVVPADVVRFFGVKLFEDLRLEAKKGLQGMEDNGRIGGEKIPNPSSNEITDADVDQIEQMLSEEGVESGGLNQGGLLEKLVKTAQSNSMVNERMRASGIPMQMNAGGAIGQQIPSNSQYNDPKKIDAVISKIASAAQQNPKLLRMLTERGINIPTNLASQNSEQLRKSNLPSQTTEPITNAASGGFIPTENYTEVQDMISNKAKKSSNVDNQMTQNFYHGGSVHDSYSVADVLAAPSLPGSYLTPGAGTLGSSGSNYQSAPIGPQEPEGGCAEGFMWNGIACVPIPVTVQSNNNDDDNNRPPPEPPKPWYEEEAIGDLSDDTWIENKLNPEEQPQGFVAGILSNMPIAKFGRHVQKYTNIAEVRAASRLALAAGKIDDKRLAEIEANLQGYIKSEGLNETWSSISQGNFQEKSVMRSFDLDGDPSNLTEAEYNAYITASGGVVEPVVETVTPKSTDVTDKETIAANLQKANIAQNTETAAERRDRKRENRENAAQVSAGTTASKKAAQSKVKAGTSKKVIRDLSGATVKAGSGVGTNKDGSDFSGPMNKGGLMKKKNK